MRNRKSQIEILKKREFHFIEISKSNFKKREKIMKKSVVYLLSVQFNNSEKSIDESVVFFDKNIAVEEFYRNFHNILPDIENYKNKSSQYQEKYIADREYSYFDEKIVVDIKIQEIEAIKFKNNLDYINAQMTNFPPIL